MLDDMMHIILVSMNVKLHSRPNMFRKVVRQQIWGEVVDLMCLWSYDHMALEKFDYYYY